jgi:hypothetical protein
MASLSTRAPRVKPARSIRLVVPLAGGPGVVRVTVGRETADYVVTPIRADFGRGFLVEKVGADGESSYHVHLDGDRRSCECRGFARYGYCRHADGLAALAAAGRL